MIANTRQIDQYGEIFLSPSLYGDGHPTWIHRCGDVSWSYAGTPNHRVVDYDPITLEGSLLCTTCGLHGWVEQGAWRSA